MQKKRMRVLAVLVFTLIATELFAQTTLSYWRFEEGVDGSGSAGQVPTTSGWIISDFNNGVIAGTASQAGSGPEYYDRTAPADPQDLAMRFSSTVGDYFTVANSHIINLSEDESFTVEFLFKIEGGNTDGSTANWLMAKNYPDSSNHGWGFRQYDDVEFCSE